ncbi:hypothetical protein BOX15_Mlig011478g2, partial [Macrostomum lignano]
IQLQQSKEMGTFLGHLLPGAFFLLFALWWLYSVLSRYYRAKYRRGPAYRSTVVYPCCCCCVRLPLEGFIKMICCGIGFTAELVTAFENRQFTFFGNGQHATMYACFAMSGLVDILAHCKAPLPPGTDYAVCLMAFCVEAILFTFHLHGRTQIDVVLHTLLVYTVWCCVLALLLELRRPRSPLPALARCFFTALQGSWFIQVGAMLYPPVPWLRQFQLTKAEHDSIMLATVIFAWHGLAIFIFALCLAMLISRYHARRGPMDGGDRREVSMERLIKSDGQSGRGGGASGVGVDDDDEDSD